MNRLIVVGILSIVATTGAFAQKPRQGGKPGPYAAGANANVKDPKVEKLKAEAAKLDAQLKKKPKDGKLRERTAEAYYQAGYACEYSKAALMPRPRYYGALVLYRKCLALNPNHTKAAFEKKQIEGIYRGMPGGIPK